MKLSKRTLIIAAAIEVVIITFCLVVSIIVMTTIDPMGSNNIVNNGPFIGNLQDNPLLFALAIVLPLFIIFVVDGVYLIMYATQKESMLNEQEKAELLEEAKRQAREEALAELKKEKEESKVE